MEELETQMKLYGIGIIALMMFGSIGLYILHDEARQNRESLKNQDTTITQISDSLNYKSLDSLLINKE